MLKLYDRHRVEINNNDIVKLCTEHRRNYGSFVILKVKMKNAIPCLEFVDSEVGHSYSLHYYANLFSFYKIVDLIKKDIPTPSVRLEVLDSNTESYIPQYFKDTYNQNIKDKSKIRVNITSKIYDVYDVNYKGCIPVITCLRSNDKTRINSKFLLTHMYRWSILDGDVQPINEILVK